MASTPFDLSSPALRTKLGEVFLGAGGGEGAGDGEEDGSLAIGEVGDDEGSEVVRGVEVGEGGVGKLVANRYGGGGGESGAEEEEGGGGGSSEGGGEGHFMGLWGRRR